MDKYTKQIAIDTLVKAYFPDISFTEFEKKRITQLLEPVIQKIMPESETLVRQLYKEIGIALDYIDMAYIGIDLPFQKYIDEACQRLRDIQKKLVDAE